MAGPLDGPVPRQQLRQARDRQAGHAGEDVGEPCPRSMSFSLAVTIKVTMKAVRSPPRSDPANSHALRPRAMPRNARSAALLVRQIRPSSKNRVKAPQRPSLSII